MSAAEEKPIPFYTSTISVSRRNDVGANTVSRRSERRKVVIGFLFPEESDDWLAILRLGLGLLVVLYSLSLLNDWSFLFATSGAAVVTRDLAEGLLSLQTSLVPRLGWLVAIGARLGLREETVLLLIWGCLFSAGIGLLVGIYSRFSALLAWFFHLCAAKSGAFVSYGIDDFMTIGLFYLMLSPLPDRYSLDRWRRNLRPEKSWTLGFFRRILQLHLSLIYFFSGLTKCLGSGWWNGSNLWQALTRPPFDVISPEILVRWKLLFPTMGIAICLIEIGYPVFIWLSKTRSLWLLAVIVMHAAIGVMMGMYLFAFVMIVLNLAAFGPGIFVLSRKVTGRLQVPPTTAD
jgi:Vitamin K-dependent gamma-carboxylase